MEKDLDIFISGYEEDNARQLAAYLQLILTKMEENKTGYDFRRMHKIIIASDFGGALNQLSKDYGRRAITYTNDEYGQAIAKVNLVKDAEGLKIVPVFNGNFLAMLLDKNVDDNLYDERLSYVINFVHHEFCHVHDENKHIDAYGDIILTKQLAGKDRYTYPLAKHCWSEYIACFLSSSSVTDSIMVLPTFVWVPPICCVSRVSR